MKKRKKPRPPAPKDVVAAKMDAIIQRKKHKVYYDPGRVKMLPEREKPR